MVYSISLETGAHILKLSLASRPVGIYFVRIVYENGDEYSEKLIIQK